MKFLKCYKAINDNLHILKSWNQKSYVLKEEYEFVNITNIEFMWKLISGHLFLTKQNKSIRILNSRHFSHPLLSTKDGQESSTTHYQYCKNLYSII